MRILLWVRNTDIRQLDVQKLNVFEKQDHAITCFVQHWSCYTTKLLTCTVYIVSYHAKLGNTALPFYHF